MEEVATRYTLAMLDFAGTDAEKLESELALVWDAMQSNPELAQALRHPELDEKTKWALLTKLSAGYSESARAALRLLLDRKRLALLGEVIAIFRQKRLEALGEVEVQMETVTQPEAGILTKVKKLVADLTGRKPQIKVIINPKILGGMRLSFDDRVIDASLRKRLDEVVELVRG